MRPRARRTALWAAGLIVASAAPAAGQVAGGYASPEAERLHRVALEHRERRDDALVRYTALVRQRMGAGIRMPLKDRTLYRSESASRVFWWRDGRTLVQVLALREQTPLGVQEEVTKPGLADQPFDPLNDALFFGLVEPDDAGGRVDPDGFWFEHPLVEDFVSHYRFSVGDTLTLSLPDGRRLQAVELQVVPTRADVHRMTGSLWIEPGTGALVRAVYRLSEPFDAFRDIRDLREEEDDDLKHVPGLFKPWTFDLQVVAVEYGLWNFDVWLPRSLRAEGVATAGILTAPAALDLTYEMEEVLTQSDLDAAEARGDTVGPWAVTMPEGEEEGPRYVVEAGWSRRRDQRGRRTVRYLVPEDPAVLRESPRLPPPIWEEAPGFITEDELDDFTRTLQALPGAPTGTSLLSTFRWGAQRPDLVRYNRVEGLSLGARGQLYPATSLGRITLTATARLGTGDREPNGRLDVVHESLRRRVTLSGFRELAAVEEGARHLGLGNSLTALLLGRDDGDYYRRSGVALEVTPPAAERQTFRARAFAERHGAVANQVSFALGRARTDGWSFRPNLQASEGWDVGAAAEWTPWWGSDPRLPQGGIRMGVRGGVGDWSYRTVTAGAGTALPLPGSLRLAAEVEGGTSWGAPPPQRGFLVGGATTLRGYEGAAMSGASTLRGRGELARHFAFGAVSVFSDGAWAGPRDSFELDDALWSAGVGLSLADGLIRVDAAWGLREPRDFRLELYLDGIL